MVEPERIGIVGGMGPHAGLDLAAKVLDETVASRDQDHLPLVLVSLPGTIDDRTAFLLGEGRRNPATAIAAAIAELESLGCRVIGMPCNTAHAPAIFDQVTALVADAGGRARLLHMVREVAAFLDARLPTARRVGVLATTGTVRTEIYAVELAAVSRTVEVPGDETQHELHRAIYDREWGIKASPRPITEQARARVLAAAGELCARGAEALVLACTELPLALPGGELDGVPLVDATRVLARALVAAVAPARLRPIGAAR